MNPLISDDLPRSSLLRREEDSCYSIQVTRYQASSFEKTMVVSNPWRKLFRGDCREACCYDAGTPLLVQTQFSRNVYFKGPPREVLLNLFLKFQGPRVRPFRGTSCEALGYDAETYLLVQFLSPESAEISISSTGGLHGRIWFWNLGPLARTFRKVCCEALLLRHRENFATPIHTPRYVLIWLKCL